jgi:hypothetical protein
MRIAIQADDGDELSICADFISVEQAVVTMEIANSAYTEGMDFDTITLTTEKARELASALISVADAIDVVRVRNCYFSMPHGLMPKFDLNMQYNGQSA